MSFNVEVSEVNFINTDNVTYNFVLSYSSIPIVTATSDQNVNVFVDSVTTSSAVIRTSQKGQFKVYIHVIDTVQTC